MFKKIMAFVWRILLNLFVLSATVALLPRIFTTIYAQNKLTTFAEAEHAPVGIVFGAGLKRDGEPAAVLRDRIQAAAEIYQAGKVDTLLMSGYGAEPAAMQEYAIELGVPLEAIELDVGGWRTYDTCYRARYEYNLDKAILVTQPFHMPRALYLCSAMGITVQGIEAHQGRYWRGAMTYWQVRETLATVAALWEVYISKPIASSMQQ
jgi:SanA protein